MQAGERIGRGVVNDLLNSKTLPELHIPGYKFTGPGTKVKERLLKGDIPVNELDKAAQLHDMASSIFKDTEDRHVFDKKNFKMKHLTWLETQVLL